MIANYWYLPNLLSIEECDNIKRNCLEQLEESRIENKEQVNHSIRKAKTCFIENKSPTAKKLSNELDKIIRKFRTVSIKFFKCELNFIEPLQFGQYSENEYYNWHLDAGPDFDRDISASVFLDDPESYEGGDFEFHEQTLGVPSCQLQGSIMIFPSLLRHRIKTVTKGVRHSLVFWGTKDRRINKVSGDV